MKPEVAPPVDRGYGWRVDDSTRLRAAIARKAARGNERGPSRLPILEVVAEMAQRHGADPAKLADPAEGDRLLSEKETQLHHERLARQSAILLDRLPARYREATIPRTDFGALAFKWLNGYRQGARHSLVIMGPTGTGKTWTACAIARCLLTEDTVPVNVTTTAEFLASLRPGADEDMALWASSPVLVLDDLGTEKLTEWGEEQMYRVAHDRSHNNRPMIVTTNLSGQEIRARYEQRTVERLFGGADLITLSGETLRPMPF